MSAAGCGAEGELGLCLDVARVLGNSRGRSTSRRPVSIGCSETSLMIGGSATDVSELFVTCILVQRHEATSQEEVKKTHLCLSIPINSLCAHVVPLLHVLVCCVACFLVGAQSIVQRFDAFLCPC